MTVSPEEALEWAGIQSGDRDDVLQLLEKSPSPLTLAAVEYLHNSIGVFPLVPPEPDDPSQSGGLSNPRDVQLAWLHAYLLFLPEQRQWYTSRGIPEDIAKATTADIGRQLAISRRVTGEFSLTTWAWLRLQASGFLYQLGRLQFHLLETPTDAPLTDSVCLDVHIPEMGGFPELAVHTSFEKAQHFFAAHFAEHPVSYGICTSWLLDPYLTEHLAATSNIVRFAQRFAIYGEPLPHATDAFFFVFRTKDMETLDSLPQDTSLQRLVVDRVRDGGSWTVQRGYLKLADQ